MKDNAEAALKTAIRLRCYEDVLDQQQTYCIIAVCAVACEAFEIASKAFTELETLETVSHGLINIYSFQKINI